MNISGKDRVLDGLANNEIMIGWSHAKGLIDAANQQAIRRVVQEEYYEKDDPRAAHGAGKAAASLWRFLHVMNKGDLVVVPRRGTRHFFVAEVLGRAEFAPNRVEDDTAHFRCVRWLNAKKSFPRKVAYSDLQHRLTGRTTCVDATPLRGEIQRVIREYEGERGDAAAKKSPLDLFLIDLVCGLEDRTLTKMRKGVVNDRAFEQILEQLFVHLGGRVEVRPRRLDKGADLVVDMPMGSMPLGFFGQRIAIQAKYYQGERLVDVRAVRQLIAGMKAENADRGVVITTSDFNQATRDFVAKEYPESIRLINGHDLAKIVVEHGLWR